MEAPAIPWYDFWDLHNVPIWVLYIFIFILIILCVVNIIFFVSWYKVSKHNYKLKNLSGIEDSDSDEEDYQNGNNNHL